MFVRYSATICMAAAFTFTGCSSYGIGTRYPEARPLGHELAVYEAPSEPDEPAPSFPEAPEPEGELLLHDAMAQALLYNPKLADVSWNVRISEARMLQASLRPNPEFEVEVEEFGGAGPRKEFRAAETSIRLSQVFELGGKRGARKRIAGAEAQLANYDFEAERLAVLMDATLGFIDVLVTQEQLRLEEDLLRISEETFAVVAERVGAGKVSPLEETKASIELANRKIQQVRASSNLHVARKRLAATWGSAAPRFAKATGTLDRIEDIPALEALETLVLMNPDVARWAEEMEHQLAELAAERAQRVFDLTVNAGVRRFEETDDYAFTLGLSMAVPLMDRNQGGVREARYRLAQVEHKSKTARVRATTALSESYEALASARTEALALKHEVVPAAGRALEASRRGYQLGKFGYLEVLDAQRTYFETNSRLLEALAEYHRGVAVVESLIGTRLDSLLEKTRSRQEE